MTYMQSNLAFASGIQELSVDEIGFVSGGLINAPPGSPLLGINSWVPDCLENWYYGRYYGGGGLWFEPWDVGMYSAWDKDGNWVAMYEETTQANASRSISGGSSAGYDSTNRNQSGAVYLRLAG